MDFFDVYEAAGKAMGARVIAAASSDEKLDVAEKAGADELVNYADGELKEKVKALTDGKGADVIYDFVDVGLPSTAVDPDEYRKRLRDLLSLVDGAAPDVVVAEAGASPLEPYNGEIVLEELASAIRCTVLCASDPYAVAGVIQGFGFEPDVVAGMATNTSAAVDLVRRLTGQRGFSFMAADSSEDAFAVIRKRLGV